MSKKKSRWKKAGKWALAGATGGATLLAPGLSPIKSSDVGAGAYNPTFDPAIESEQSDLSGYLKARATGQSPSLAQMQTERGLRENERQGVQAIRSMGSVSPALRQRMIAQRQAQTGAEISSRGGEAELAERQGAQQGLSELLMNRRKQRMEEEQLRSGAYASSQEQRAALIRGLAGAGATAMAK